MSDAILHLYHRLPPRLQSLAATARGFQLNRWRYSAETDALVAAAHEREHWSAEQWRRWQQERLTRLLHRAATRVPFYRDLWTGRRRRGDPRTWEDLANWPVLEKDQLRRTPRAFVADDCDTRTMIHEHTSGTTGKPLNVWFDRSTVRAWYALYEARWRRWNGVSRHDRWAMLGGQLVAPIRRDRPPFWVWNGALNQLYMSSYHLAAPNVGAYLDALRRYRIRYLVGYTSSLHTLAQLATAAGLDAPKMEVAVTNAEPLYGHQREAIASAFSCDVRESYGMTEIACAASECEAGTLHLWPEVGVLEVVDDRTGHASASGRAGRLLCTGLLNMDMPLIRYAVGDRGTLSSSATCGCGRTLPHLAAIDGRADDALITRDGRKIGRLDPVFKGDMSIREAQIIQESLDRIRVRLVPTSRYRAADGDQIAARLRDRLGDVEVIVEPVDHIPRGPNGKFRAVVRSASLSLEAPTTAPTLPH